LDPQARLHVWDRIAELRQRGVTMMLTTHDMDEAATLADRVGIIDHGRLLALDTPRELTRGLTAQAVLDLTATPAAGDTAAELLATLLTVDGVKHGELTADGPEAQLRLYVTEEPATVLAPVVTALAARSSQLSGVQIGHPTLEDVFIHHTGRSLR
jgi:ABC-2 type transport system ATP-binding protein